MSNPLKIEIKRGIQMPTTRSKYPFESMKVGDSFQVPKEYTARVRAAVGKVNKSGQCGQFRTRTLYDGTLGIWKISDPIRSETWVDEEVQGASQTRPFHPGS